MKFDTNGNLMQGTSEEFARDQAHKLRKYWSAKGRNDFYAEVVSTRSGWKVLSNANDMLVSKR